MAGTLQGSVAKTQSEAGRIAGVHPRSGEAKRLDTCGDYTQRDCVGSKMLLALTCNGDIIRICLGQTLQQAENKGQ